MRYLGAALLWAAALVLAITHPWLPGWAWGLLFAALFYYVGERLGERLLKQSGVLLLGWGLGAMLADLTGLFSLKLVGVGAALLALGGELAYLGAVVVGVGVLVGVFEVGVAPWLGVVLAGLGLFLLLKGSSRSSG